MLRSVISDGLSLELAALGHYGHAQETDDWRDIDRKAKQFVFRTQAKLRQRLGIKVQEPTARLSRLGTAHLVLAALEDPIARSVLDTMAVDADALAAAVVEDWFNDPLENGAQAPRPQQQDRLTTAFERLVNLRACIQRHPRAETLMVIFESVVEEVKQAPFVMPEGDDAHEWRSMLAADVTRVHVEALDQLRRYGLGDVPESAQPTPP